VDESNKKLSVGGEMDVTEYLLNFIERIEEGLDELPQKDANEKTEVFPQI
jgi:hypothetical protein